MRSMSPVRLGPVESSAACNEYNSPHSTLTKTGNRKVPLRENPQRGL